jgi:hypothetical protein
MPGVEPLAELKRALLGLFGRTEVREVYPLIETDGLRPVIERLPGSERLLLVVDQFEEVFTVCPKEEERRLFIELLTQVAEIPASRLAIVTTMRADFLEPCLRYESLTRLIQNEAVYMPPLVGAELEEVIVTPANLQGYQLETGLLGAILQDVGQEKECLPLLQFTLTELWEHRDRQTHQLMLTKYDELGAVIGTLNRHAEQIYHSFTQQEQEWIQRIFLKLVRTGSEAKDTRQRQPKPNLLAIAGESLADQQTLSDFLDKLIEGRLLVTGQEYKLREAWVDLAHEALIDGWQRFAQWCQENRPLRRLIDRIEDALREWQKQPKNENLMMGGLLAQVREKWFELEPDLDATARDFYQQSDTYERQRIIEGKGQAVKATFLAEASVVLMSSLDYETTLARVAQLAVPEIADCCTVDILQENQIVRVAVAHLDPTKVELLWELTKDYPDNFGRVAALSRRLGTGQSTIISEISDSELLAVAQDKGHLQILRELGLKSCIVVPMLAHGRTLGVITFAMTKSERRYSVDDLLLVENLAHRAALAVNNALLYRKAQQPE